MKRKIWVVGVLMLLLTLVLSGCFVKTVDELYTLPKHSDEYNDLQNAIDGLMAQGAAYSAPVSGANQQSVQLADLDGDGQDEAIVFLKTGGDKPLGAYIFDLIDGAYQNIAVIEGGGTAFASAEYVQLDNEGGVEILIGRKLSDQVIQTLGVYSLSDGHIVELMNANYSEYTLADLDGDGNKDIFLIRFDAEQAQGVAELYRFRDGQMAREPEAQLTALPPDGGVAERYILPGAQGYVGLIRPVSCQFCAGCNRLRLTADGKLKPCLHSGQEISIRGLDDEAMRAQFLRAIREKPAQHAPLDLAHQSEAGRNMNEIGG